jgi:Zn-finger nucleic acid-binding protein
MQCPVCKNVNLVMSERQGIEIDYCPQCRGVWLDRGELDKIIERSAPPARPEDLREAYPTENHLHHGYHRESGQHRKKKRGGFLDDLFDFD